MPSDHPFQQLFETFGKLPAAHSESVNREAREALKGWLDAPVGDSGRCILLKAPRAGHGKTHLLTRLQHELGGSHEFIPLHAIGGSRIDAATALDDTLRRLVRALPAAGGLAVLDLVARRLFSTSLQPLVNSGEVPCQDREGALVALRDRPIETFDFHHPGAVTAHWAKENFELLGPRLALELSQRNGLSLREVSFWVDAMFRFAATPIDNPGRVRALAAQVFDGPNAESAAHERLVALLGLLSSLLRVVLVADELEGFSLDESAALRFASFIGSLRQSVDRADVILSVNQDVWENAFLPRLSGGLADRLSEVCVEIGPLDRKGMIAVIESRAPGQGERIVASLGATYARGLIREAAEAWGRKEEAESPSVAPPQPEAPAFSPPVDSAPTPVAFEPTAPAAFEPPAPVAPEPAAQPSFESAPSVPVDAPTNFSPEAAIAAFKSFPEPFGTTSEAPPASDPLAMENSWPNPDANSSPAFPPASDFAPSSAFQSEPDRTVMDSPFIIDTAPEPPLTPVEAPPLAQVVSPPPAQVVSPPPAELVCPPPAQVVSPPPANQVPVSPAVQLPPPSPSIPEASTDRVDDLLRQFRERYGKS